MLYASQLSHDESVGELSFYSHSLKLLRIETIEREHAINKQTFFYELEGASFGLLYIFT